MAENKLRGEFKWVLEEGLTEKLAEKYMICKAVVATSGERKDGEATYTPENIIGGIGAMRHAVATGTSFVSIDHHDEKLPKEYLKKYGNAISNPYPPGFILDAQTTEDDNGTVAEVIFACKNRHVYNMIKNGMFKGCSVDDTFRQLACTKGECIPEGNMFPSFTLVLEYTPQLDDTWVSTIDKDDIARMAHKPGKIINSFKEHIHSIEEASNYIKGGKWINGEASIEQFLIKVKKIEKSKAALMANYAAKNPEEISLDQLVTLDSGALLGWWQPHEKKRLARLFGLDQIGYTDPGPEGQNCTNCRFFNAENADDPNGPGACIFTTEGIMATGGCTERYEVMPGAEPEEPEEDPEADPEETEEMAKENAEKTKTETKTETKENAKAPSKSAVKTKDVPVKNPDYILNASKKMDEEIIGIDATLSTLDQLRGLQAVSAQATYERLLQRRLNLINAKKKLDLSTS